jgi:hypothetical protein
MRDHRRPGLSATSREPLACDGWACALQNSQYAGRIAENSFPDAGYTGCFRSHLYRSWKFSLEMTSAEMGARVMSFGQRSMGDHPPVAWLWLLISTIQTRESATSWEAPSYVGWK